ncbi:MAG: hypothetical protein LC667_14010 [Thioalkalivibrio sp.]|nr:hypothetical protein [Thioalkalivibrio sp.]
MTLPIYIGLVVILIAAVLFTFSLARAAARGDRMAHEEYQMRYTGGGAPCVECGEPTHYTVRGVPTHPGCRKDIA